METLNTSTTEQLNNLIEFRQTVYDQILVGVRDAQFELMDAVLLSDQVGCFAELSLSPTFRRRWSSAYSAVEDGSQALEKLKQSFMEQVASEGVQVFPLDTTIWAHPRARTLSGLIYGRSPTKALKRHSIVQGHAYSLLTWTPEPGRSWSLPISSQRVEASQSAIEVGVAQVKALCQARLGLKQTGLDVIVADGHYGNHRFFGPLKELPCAALARLYRNRVLYGEPGPYSGRGRPRVHGARFAFKEADTWPESDERKKFEHEHWGTVQLRRWNNLHAKQDPQTRFDVILAEVHLERDKPSAPLWLGYLPDQTKAIAPDLVQIWSWFDYRWPIEPSIRFRKQKLYWTLPRFQDTDQCDRWTILVDVAYWQVFQARQIVQDQPLPWQKAQSVLTPGRVLRGMGAVFAQIGTPAQPPQTRGKSPGWPKGRPRPRPKQYKPTKRGRKKRKTA
jgi:hypothetical protein